MQAQPGIELDARRLPPGELRLQARELALERLLLADVVVEAVARERRADPEVRRLEPQDVAAAHRLLHVLRRDAVRPREGPVADVARALERLLVAVRVGVDLLEGVLFAFLSEGSGPGEAEGTTAALQPGLPEKEP